MPTLDLIRRLAERHARSELEIHGSVTPSAQLFYANTSDIIYPNRDEPWAHFVTHMLAERTEYRAHALVLYRQVIENAYVSVMIMPSDGVPIELHIPAEGV